MTRRFDSNNNNSEWMEEIQMLDMKEICVNQWYINIFINILIQSINERSYILTGV
ncbi:hypothetical protein ID0635_05060 [Helicobacter pylori]